MKVEALLNYTDILNHFKKEFYAQIKYDGKRVQIHKNGQELNIFFKVKGNPYPVSDDFKKILLKGIPAQSIILDCEIIKIHPISKVPYGTFRAGSKNKTAFEAIRVFDCLYLNGKLLVGQVYSERKKHLLDETVVRFELDRFEMVKEFVIPVKGGLSILSSLIEEHVYTKDQEGLVFKYPDHIYGNKNNIGKWYKYKHTYLKTIDYELALIGASQDLKSILLGVFDKGENRFKSVTWCLCRSNELSLKIFQSMTPINNRDNIPSYLDLSQKVLEGKIKKPNNNTNFKLMYWLKESSIKDKTVVMVDITVEELLDSTTHSSNITCRTPIFIGFRDSRDCTFKNGTGYDQLKSDLGALKNKQTPLKEQPQPKPKDPLSKEEYRKVINQGILNPGEHYMDQPCSYNLDCIDYIIGNKVSPNPESFVLFIEMKSELPDGRVDVLTKNFKSNSKWYHLLIKCTIKNISQFIHTVTCNKCYFSTEKIRLQSIYFRKPKEEIHDGPNRWAHYSTFLNLFYSSLGIKVYVNCFEDSKDFEIIAPQSEYSIPITRSKKRNIDEVGIPLKQINENTRHVSQMLSYMSNTVTRVNGLKDDNNNN